uniref:GRIP domain-containing protein n=1 Tax=Globisporangium ultimum (strain ATCC 200006 / CBS 805.95 / DAOM BR144) TaxID=431595 RepID=K3WIR6_GLOUD
MWSKFTEYAEGIVEKVAQADAAAAAAAGAGAGPSDPPSSSSPPLSASSISGEEIWSRFTSIVAPPVTSSAGKDAQDGEDDENSERDEYDAAALSANQGAGVPRQQQQPLSATTAKTIDEDEQEQYICELERALLQRKKQHEVLEKRVYELEYHHEQEAQRFKLQLQEKEKVIADQTRRIESAAAQPQTGEHEAAAAKQVVEKVELLEQRLRGLMARCSAIEASRDLARTAQSNVPAAVQEHDTLAASGLSAARVEDEKTLQQVANLLSKMVENSSETVGRTPGDGTIGTHVLELATQVQADFKKSAARAAALERAIDSFLACHGELGGPTADPSTIASRLDAISGKIMKSAAAAVEVDRLQAKIHLLEDKEEEQLKKILHLQAQANGMHANLQKTDQSLQQTASKEADLLDQMNEKDATIQRLQANLTQVKASMEHLASELKEAQSYTDELEGYCRQQKQKIASQREQLKELDQVKAAFNALQEQEREMRAQAAEYEQGYVELLAEMEALKAQNEEESKLLIATTEAHAMSTENQTIYDLESRLSATEADKQVALQDAARLQQNVDALEGVLHQFQVDQKQQRERLLGLELALEKAQDTIREQHQHLQSKTNNKEGGDKTDTSSDLQRVMDVLAKKNLECEQLREALENTAARYTAENDVLDKRLAAQLVVTYFETDRKGDVLQLIARMMGFSEDQKRRVGLGFSVEGNGGGGLFSSILGFVAPSSDDRRQQQGIEAANANDATIDGKSFADIWTEFLLEEAKK